MEKSFNNKLLLSKLRQPLDLEFISSNILKTKEFEAKEYLDELVDDGILIKENNYYTIKNRNK
jgi:hypothetical protein